ncbi:OsmC family protein [Adhaeribacter aquaticus]|uniref:OsmC family protein n=1 Tax=Adhaeribacter aquaticus TaxID=299567 RepID=UPI0004126A7E|nr:OsmC family protein [Adhaeribacter aquaticus]
MTKHSASAIWNGGLKDGKGNVSTGSGALNSPFSFKTRFEGDKNGTTPEELIGAAHAGCFSMFLSSLLEGAGHPAKHINTDASVNLAQTADGPLIDKIELTTEVEAPGLDDAQFQELVKKAKEGCPISKALKSVPDVKVNATLK